MGGKRASQSDRHSASDDARGAQHADIYVCNVHGAALASVQALVFSVELCHHGADISALGNGMTVASMGRCDKIVLIQVGACADCNGFRADVGVGQAVNLVFHPKCANLGIKFPDEAHLPIHFLLLV